MASCIAARDQHYKYSALPHQHSFRYLILLPGEKDDEICYRLTVSDMRKPPAYEAISYTWGDPNIKVPSFCDGKLLEITPSLQEGLRHLRYKSETRLLWADAVCINQENIKEKNRQVMNMKRIYENATRVVVWLGLDEPCGNGNSTKATVAAKTINKVTQEIIDHFNSLDPNARSELWIRHPGVSPLESATSVNHFSFPLHTTLQADDLFHIYNLPRLVQGYPFNTSRWSTESIHSIGWLFKRPWFTRLWVVQEISSSTTPAKLLCGNVELSWEHTYLCADWLTHYQPLVLENFPDFPNGILRKVIFIRNIYSFTSEFFFDVLHYSSTYKATEERDYLYALFGHRALKQLASNISVDYEIPLQVLYKRVFHWFVAHGGNLDILSFAQRDGHLKGDSPSWAPQWHKESNLTRVLYPALTFSASATSHPDYSFPNLEELHTLLVNGFCFDTVSRVWDHPNLIGAWREAPVDSLVDMQNTRPLLGWWVQQWEASTAYESGSSIASIDAVGATWVSGMVRIAGYEPVGRTKDFPDQHKADLEAFF